MRILKKSSSRNDTKAWDESTGYIFINRRIILVST